jgi:hypothetical protein
MPGVRDLLDRFRPAGAPGSAGAAGVPLDRQAATTTELDPVFAALAPVVAECRRLRRDAAREAARREAAAAEQARALVARARNAAAADRAAAAARVREDVAAEVAQLNEVAAAEAEEVRRRGAQRLPWLVSRVVDLVRDDLATLEDGPHRAGEPR